MKGLVPKLRAVHVLPSCHSPPRYWGPKHVFSFLFYSYAFLPLASSPEPRLTSSHLLTLSPALARCEVLHADPTSPATAPDPSSFPPSLTSAPPSTGLGAAVVPW